MKWSHNKTRLGGFNKKTGGGLIMTWWNTNIIRTVQERVVDKVED